MKHRFGGATMVGVVGLGLLLGASVVKSQTGAVHVDSAKATYKELVPGVSVAVAWGDMDKGPYGAFIKFVRISSIDFFSQPGALAMASLSLAT